MGARLLLVVSGAGGDWHQGFPHDGARDARTHSDDDDVGGGDGGGVGGGDGGGGDGGGGDGGGGGGGGDGDGGGGDGGG